MSVAHYENFPVASFMLPAAVRPAVVAIYRFARAADDIADEGDADAPTRLAALARFDDALDAIHAGHAPGQPPFPELAIAIRRHALPLDPFRDLISAFRQDVTTARYASFDRLLDYCRRSANPVGRLMLALHGAATADNLVHSDAICTALQLINFWQDVALDWKKGRVYLPQDDLAYFDIDESQIGQARADRAWRALMHFETTRARAMLESGRPLTRAVPWRLGMELRGILAGGHRILDRIDAVQGDVFAHRPQLRRADWMAVAWQAAFPRRRHVAATSAYSA